ncbi:MAG TPA: hypothetical protein VN442_00310 [Bryobacteraceae bacterium]|nr:hypothetical protein [Bryobacteraceae bacterium]
MSTIVCLKDGRTLVLGTDSRVMTHDWSGVASDAMPKIIQVAPETFIATSGYVMACEFEHQKARELAGQLGTTDISVISEALERGSVAHLNKLAEIMPSVKDLNGSVGIDDVLSGKKLMHGCVLVGRIANGTLGYVTHEYRLRAGQVVNERGGYSAVERRIFSTTGELVRHLGQDPATWTDSPAQVVRRFLAALKQASPHIGGPDQIVQLDDSGAHWLSRPPAMAAAGSSAE